MKHMKRRFRQRYEHLGEASRAQRVSAAWSQKGVR